MLVLTRRIGEEIVIANNIRVKIVSIKGDRIRIGITAPDNVTVDRAEVHNRRMEFVEVPVHAMADADTVQLGELANQSASDETLVH